MDAKSGMDAREKGYVNRLKRAEGQMRGIARMIEEEKSCTDVVTQLSAVRASIDRLITLLVTENLMGCAEGGGPREENRRHIEEAVALLMKSR